MAKTPESTPVNPPDIKQTPASIPVGPDGMTDYIRRPEIQSETKDFLAKLRAEVNQLIHPEQKVTSTPDVGAPVTATNEVGVNINSYGETSFNPNNIVPPGVTVPEGSLPGF